MDKNNNLIDFLIRSSVLKFGDFTTKSGRKSPYFMNFGAVCGGNDIRELCLSYAEAIRASSTLNPDIIFGPAYKGVPLAVIISTLLDQYSTEKNVYFTFNRKEKKAHGEGGNLVGKNPVAGDKIVIVEDVVTAGTTLKEVVPMIRALGDITLEGLVICVDRQEKIDPQDSQSAVDRLSNELDLPIISLLKVTTILDYLAKENSSGFTLTKEQIEKSRAYLEQYGCI